ncbi:MAG: septal ring lytic transglycosylase RlpA family protein [Thiotrichales bacterium]
MVKQVIKPSVSHVIWILAGLTTIGLGGCSRVIQDGPGRAVDVDQIANAVPKPEPLCAKGNPDSYVQDGVRYVVAPQAYGTTQRGQASWYGTKYHGRSTSCGEPYDMYAMTAAHPTIPLPAYMRVTNLSNQRSVVVRVNDRGPFKDGRIIDLSYVAAMKLGIASAGTAEVETTLLDPRDPARGVPVEVTPIQEPTALRAQVLPVQPLPQPASQAVPIPTAAVAPSVAAPSVMPGVASAEASPAPSSAGYFLQVGAYVDRGNAERLLRQLVDAEVPYSARLIPVETGGATLHKVQVGPFDTEQAALQAGPQLQQQGFRYQMIRP